MSIKKIGTPNKILEIVKNKEEFDKLWQNICKSGDLIRCKICNHLVSKKDMESGYITLKHKNLSAIIKSDSVQFTCPFCSNIIKID
jgi:hypothetical protein